jgi:hypothetical protein
LIENPLRVLALIFRSLRVPLNASVNIKFVNDRIHKLKGPLNEIFDLYFLHLSTVSGALLENSSPHIHRYLCKNRKQNPKIF